MTSLYRKFASPVPNEVFLSKCVGFRTIEDFDDQFAEGGAHLQAAPLLRASPTISHLFPL
jgi:hypothetical protein